MVKVNKTKFKTRSWVGQAMVAGTVLAGLAGTQALGHNVAAAETNGTDNVKETTDKGDAGKVVPGETRKVTYINATDENGDKHVYIKGGQGEAVGNGIYTKPTAQEAMDILYAKVQGEYKVGTETNGNVNVEAPQHVKDTIERDEAISLGAGEKADKFGPDTEITSTTVSVKYAEDSAVLDDLADDKVQDGQEKDGFIKHTSDTKPNNGATVVASPTDTAAALGVLTADKQTDEQKKNDAPLTFTGEDGKKYTELTAAELADLHLNAKLTVIKDADGKLYELGTTTAPAQKDDKLTQFQDKLKAAMAAGEDYFTFDGVLYKVTVTNNKNEADTNAANGQVVAEDLKDMAEGGAVHSEAYEYKTSTGEIVKVPVYNLMNPGMHVTITDIIDEDIVNSMSGLYFFDGDDAPQNKRPAADSYNKWTGGVQSRENLVDEKIGDDGFPTFIMDGKRVSLKFLFAPEDLDPATAAKLAGAVKTMTNADKDYLRMFAAKGDGRYEFDSDHMYVRLKDGQLINVTEGDLKGIKKDENYHGFYPLDKLPNDGIPDKQNMHFGVMMETYFQMDDEHKTINGKPMVFEFSGDDDFWLFADGQRMLDLGGIHDAERGVVDFTNQVAIYYDKNGEVMKTVRIGDISKTGTNGQHHLQMFYLEQGGVESNLKVNYALMIKNYGYAQAVTPTKVDYVWGEKPVFHHTYETATENAVWVNVPQREVPAKPETPTTPDDGTPGKPGDDTPEPGEDTPPELPDTFLPPAPGAPTPDEGEDYPPLPDTFGEEDDEDYPELPDTFGEEEETLPELPDTYGEETPAKTITNVTSQQATLPQTGNDAASAQRTSTMGIVMAALSSFGLFGMARKRKED